MQSQFKRKYKKKKNEYYNGNIIMNVVFIYCMKSDFSTKICRIAKIIIKHKQKKKKLVKKSSIDECVQVSVFFFVTIYSIKHGWYIGDFSLKKEK